MDARLNLDSQKKQAWIEELSGRSAFAESSDPRDRPYLSYAPPPPPRRPVWLRWAAAAAAVLLLAGAAFAFWPRRGLETAGEGNASGGAASPTDTTAPSMPPAVSGETTADEEAAKTTASVTSSAAGNRTNSPVAFNPDDPLAVFQDPYYIYSGFSQEQATAVFAAVDTVQELMSLNNDWSFYGRDVWKQEIVFSGMAGMREGTSYSLAENYQSNTLELRYWQDGGTAVLASKSLPAGSNFVDAYHQYVLTFTPTNILTRDTLDQILAAGHVAPLVENPDILASESTWIHAAVKQLGFSFYLAEEKLTVHIIEDYNAGELRVYTCRADAYFTWDDCWAHEPDDVRPLAAGADITDYSGLQEGWAIDKSATAGEAAPDPDPTSGGVTTPTDPDSPDPVAVTEIRISSLPESENYARIYKDAEKIKAVQSYMNSLVLTDVFPENPDEYAGATYVITLAYSTGDEHVYYHFGNMFIRKDDQPWKRMQYEQAAAFEALLQAYPSD